MKISTITTVIICILIIFTSCRCSSGSSSGTDGNSIYYWRTTFTLNEAERRLLKHHTINKIYVRFFDIDNNQQSSKGDQVTPEGTIKVIDSIRCIG